MTIKALNTDFTAFNTDHIVTVQVGGTNDPWGLVKAENDVANDSSLPSASVINVRNLSQLPMTGAAGIILAVLIAAVLFGGAFILVSIYRRRAAHTNAE